MKTINLNTLITTLERILNGEKILTTDENAWVRKLLVKIYEQGNLTHHPASIFYTDPAKIPHNNTRYFAAPSKELAERHALLTSPTLKGDDLFPDVTSFVHVFSGAFNHAGSTTLGGAEFYTIQPAYGEQIMVFPENTSVQGLLEFSQYLARKTDNEGDENKNYPIVARPSEVLSILEENLFPENTDKGLFDITIVPETANFEETVKIYAQLHQPENAEQNKLPPVASLTHENLGTALPLHGIICVNSTSVLKYLNARASINDIHDGRTRVLQGQRLCPNYPNNKELESSCEGNTVAKHEDYITVLNAMNDADLEDCIATIYGITVEKLKETYGFKRSKVAVVSDDSYECLADESQTIRTMIEADTTGTFLRAYQQLEREKGAGKGDPDLKSAWWNEAPFMEVDMSPFVEACGGLKNFIDLQKTALENLNISNDSVVVRSYSVVAVTRLEEESTPTEDLKTYLVSACVRANLVLEPEKIEPTTQFINLLSLTDSAESFSDMGRGAEQLPRNIALRNLITTLGVDLTNSPHELVADNSQLNIAVLNTAGTETEETAKLCKLLKAQGYEPTVITDIDINLADDMDKRVLSQHAGFVVVNDDTENQAQAYLNYLITTLFDAKAIDPQVHYKPLLLVNTDSSIYDRLYALGLAKIAPKHVYVKANTIDDVPATLKQYVSGIEGKLQHGTSYQPKKISEIFASEPRLNGVGSTPMTEAAGVAQPNCRNLIGLVSDNTPEPLAFVPQQLHPETPKRPFIGVLGSSSTHQPELLMAAKVYVELCCSTALDPDYPDKIVYNLVDGAGTGGVMGIGPTTYAKVNDNKLGIVGFTTPLLFEKEANSIKHIDAGQFVLKETIHERMLNIFDISDVPTFFGGGIGTAEELSLLLLLKERMSPIAAGKPIVVVDINGQYWPEYKNTPGVTYVNMDVPTYETLREEATAQNPDASFEEINQMASEKLEREMRAILKPFVRERLPVLQKQAAEEFNNRLAACAEVQLNCMT